MVNYKEIINNKLMLCTLENVTYAYSEAKVLKNISMEIDNGDIISIIGPSGAGKTTLLKLIAGLIKVQSGTIHYSPEPSIQNPIIIVFQDYLLFPHMNVFNNVAFGLKARKLYKQIIKERVIEYLKYFGLEDKMNSYPEELSAGQQQRVAIARAMIVEPDLLLLDEPFANLDYNLKAETAEFIRKTQKDFNVTTISVTHDQREAFSMSDKIGILLDGELIQLDNVENVFFKPATIKAAEFLGPLNKIERENIKEFSNSSVLPDCNLYTRPGGIELSHDINGNASVKGLSYTGSMIIYKIKQNNSIYHINSLQNGLKVGDRVSLKLLNYIKED